MGGGVELRGVGVGLDVGEGVLPPVAEVVHEHRGGALEGVDLGRRVDGVGVGAVRDGVHDVPGAVLVQRLAAQVEVLHPPGHHLGRLGLAVVEAEHERPVLLKVGLKLNNSSGIYKDETNYLSEKLPT